MSSNVYKKIELTGTSSKSIEDAIQHALAKAGKTVRMMRWFELSELRGAIVEDQVGEWQATIKVGFRLEE